MTSAEVFVLEALQQRMTQVANDPEVDGAKNRLQEFILRTHGDYPSYVVTDSVPITTNLRMQRSGSEAVFKETAEELRRNKLSKRLRRRPGKP